MPIVHLASVSKSYGSTEILKSVSFDVEAGEVVAVVGRSGSGKSTLLRCINGLEPIQSGEIVVAGHRISGSDKALRALRQEVGIVFQGFNLFPHLTVERNITIGLTVVRKRPLDEAKAIAVKVLEQVGLVDKRHAYPDQLSGGQQQRAAIARSLALSPKVMLFDEVTSALDPELKGEVLKVIGELARGGMTMILVTHEMQFARSVSSRLVFMHDGKIWETGKPDEMFDNPKTPEFQRFIFTEL
jgi:polar amino acid transport system ATP-binding protein